MVIRPWSPSARTSQSPARGEMLFATTRNVGPQKGTITSPFLFLTALTIALATRSAEILADIGGTSR